MTDLMSFFLLFTTNGILYSGKQENYKITFGWRRRWI